MGDPEKGIHTVDFKTSCGSLLSHVFSVMNGRRQDNLDSLRAKIGGPLCSRVFWILPGSGCEYRFVACGTGSMSTMGCIDFIQTYIYIKSMDSTTTKIEGKEKGRAKLCERRSRKNER